MEDGSWMVRVLCFRNYLGHLVCRDIIILIMLLQVLIYIGEIFNNLWHSPFALNQYFMSLINKETKLQMEKPLTT